MYDPRTCFLSVFEDIYSKTLLLNTINMDLMMKSFCTTIFRKSSRVSLSFPLVYPLYYLQGEKNACK